MVIKILYKTLITNLNNTIESLINRIRNQAKGKRGKIIKIKTISLLKLKN